MHLNWRLSLLVIFMTLFSSVSLAQESVSHPTMEDNFTFKLGAFQSDNKFDLSASGSLDLDRKRTDFGNAIGVDESSTILNVELRWKFGKTKKWSLSAQYFSTSSDGEKTLTQDVEWQDKIFVEGSKVGGGFGLDILRAFVGRSFVLNERHDFGIGAGIHTLSVDAFVEGDIQIDGGGTEFFRGENSASQPLPNLGAWWKYAATNRWLVHARADWISAKIDDFDGTLWNVSAGLGYQISRHFGVDFVYQYFELDVGVTKTDWNGGIEVSHSGPILSLTANW